MSKKDESKQLKQYYSNTRIAPEDKRDCYAWFRAVKKNDVETVKKMLNNGFPIDFAFTKKDDRRETALMKAGSFGYSDMVKLLIESGAEINKQDAMKQTAFMFACSNNQIETAVLLMRLKADLYVKSQSGGTGIYYHFRLNEPEFINCFLVESFIETIGLRNLNEYLLYDSNLTDMFQKHPEKYAIWKSCKIKCEDRYRMEEYAKIATVSESNRQNMDVFDR